MVGCRFLVSHSVFSRRFPACAGTFGFVNLKREENSGSERCKSWGNCEILSGLKKPLRGTLSIRDNISDLLFQLTLAFQKMCSPMFTEHSGPQWHHKVLLVFSVILSRPSVHTEWGAVFGKQQLVSTGVELRDEMRWDQSWCVAPTTSERDLRLDQIDSYYLLVEMKRYIQS